MNQNIDDNGLGNVLGIDLVVHDENELRFGLLQTLFPNSSGISAVRILGDIVSRCRNKDPHWAIKVRPQIRQLMALNVGEPTRYGSHATLNQIIASTNDETVLRLAIWARGHCGGSNGTNEIEKYRNHPNWQVRKAVAKALKKMKAWHIIAEMAEHDDHELVRRAAKALVPRLFTSRVSKFIGRLPSSNLAKPSRRLFVDKSVNFKTVYRPKPAELIREYLKRIRNTLAGR